MVEVFLAEHDEEVQTFVAGRFYPSFDKCILIGRSGSRGLDLAADVFEHLIKISDVHAIAITNEVVDSQISFARLLDESMGLANHPLPVGLKTAGRTDYSPCANMNKRQDKYLPQASRSPDHLAEEIDLPERFDMGFEKLIPTASTSLRTGLNTWMFLSVRSAEHRLACNRLWKGYLPGIGSAASPTFQTSGRNCPSSSTGVVPIFASTLVR